MSRWWLAIMALGAAIATPAAAHPSRGIAVDRQGQIYFSDLVRIWRIDGARLRLVRDKQGHHTHALTTDTAGNIVWEESRYNPADQSYTETIWQLAGNRLTRRFGPPRRLPRGMGITRNRAGCTFHADQVARSGPALVHRLCPGRAPVRLFGTAGDDARFRPALVNDVGGVALGADGSFVFRQGGTVRAIDPRGRVRVLAADVADENFGIALDGAGRLLVVEHGNRRVLRIAGGRREVVAVTPAGWAPTGIATGRGGIYLLEASEHRPGQPLLMRVRQVGADGRARLLAQVTVPGA